MTSPKSDKHELDFGLNNSNSLNASRVPSRGSNASDLEADAELQGLDDDQFSDEGANNPTETPADVAFARTRKQQQAILEIIRTTKASGSTSIDLSNKELQTFPNELCEMNSLEYMYFEENEIAFLPDDFFKLFPRLRWLDLRNNVLSRIPSVFLANHACLRDLLLEGNNLRNLPLELGQVKSLHGLNIAGNPLDFPPQEIIERGTQGILSFLREMLEAKNTTQMADLELHMSEEVPDGFEHVSASSDDWNTTASMMEIARRREMLQMKQNQSNHSQQNGHINPYAEESEDYGVGAKSAELHQPVSYSENRKQHISKLRQVGALGVVDRKKKKKESKMSWKLNQYPAPPPADYVAFRMNEDKQMARVKEFKEKTDAILQRRKDDLMLKNWRDETKVLQQQKYSQQMVPGEDYDEPAEKAPFGVQKEMMKVLSKEERLKADLQREKELKQQRSVSPATKQRIEQEKQARIRELEKRIKDHTASMVERRKQPKGSPQHEMEIARRELEIVKNLQRDLMKRYQELKSWSAG